MTGVDTELLASTGEPPDHGVSTAEEAWVPQVTGVASTADGPPKKFSLKSLNGNCGVSSKVVTRRPVFGSRAISPGSFTRTPSASPTR